MIRKQISLRCCLPTLVPPAPSDDCCLAISPSLVNLSCIGRLSLGPVKIDQVDQPGTVTLRTNFACLFGGGGLDHWVGVATRTVFVWG